MFAESEEILHKPHDKESARILFGAVLGLTRDGRVRDFTVGNSRLIDRDTLGRIEEELSRRTDVTEVVVGESLTQNGARYPPAAADAFRHRVASFLQEIEPLFGKARGVQIEFKWERQPGAISLFWVVRASTRDGELTAVFEPLAGNTLSLAMAVP